MRSLLVSFAVGVVVAATTSIAVAASNLNLSKSNLYRVVYDTAVVTPAQASTLAAELDKLGAADEAKLKAWLAANFKRLGIAEEKIKKVVVRSDSTRKSTSVMLLANPADEPAAIAVSDEGTPGQKPTKKKTN